MKEKASVRRSERYNLGIPPNRLGYGDEVDNAIRMNRKANMEKIIVKDQIQVEICRNIPKKASSDIVNLKDHSVKMKEFQNEIPNSPTNGTILKDQSGNVKSSKCNVSKLNLELKKLQCQKQFEDMLRKQEKMFRE
ncbi:hypothetical protein HHI36_002672 [Cryptolaemus montrouzieri]|uniref:Uncharacterized protein n=1 Tax=Cryptolaemus montrouzieri TaxID=559131 RepID=A0ABD2PBD0_9CUCU